MTNPASPPYPYDSDRYNQDYGVNSPIAHQEWQQFLQRRGELLGILLGQMGSMTGAVKPVAAGAAQNDPTIGMAGDAIMPSDQRAQVDEQRRDLMARAEFWRIPNAENMSIDQLQQSIGMKRAEIKQAPGTTVETAAKAFGQAAEQTMGTAARLTGNLIDNVVGHAPFVGETLRGILHTDQARNWLYNWTSKLDESSQMLVAEQPQADRTAAQFLTAAGKVAGYVMPSIAAWNGIGAVGAMAGTPGWLSWASTPLTRLAMRGGLTSAVLDDPLASSSEKAVNFGVGAVLGSATMLGFLGTGIIGGAMGAGIGSGVGDTPEEQNKNKTIGGVTGFALGAMVPFAAQSFNKVRQGIPSAFDAKMADAISAERAAIPADQSGRTGPGEVIADYEIGGPRIKPNDVGQISGNPPKLLPGFGNGELTAQQELTSLMMSSEPPRSVLPNGQLQQGALEQPRVAGLLPAKTQAPVTIYSDQIANPAYAAFDPYTAMNVLNTYTPEPARTHDLNYAYDVAKDVISNPPPGATPELLARAQEVLASVPARIDAQVFDYQRNAPPEAKGLTAVSRGPSHIIGSKVAAADGRPLRVYHGTGLDFEEFDPSRADGEALFGPGLYHTENIQIAEGYAGYEPGASFGPGGGVLIPGPFGSPVEVAPRPANIRPAFLDIKRPFNVDQKFSAPEATKFIEEMIAVYDAPGSVARDLEIPDMRRIVDFVNSEPEPQSGEELYSRLIDALGGKRAVNEALELAGYDGITHIGGARTGNDPHRVWIAFKPEQVHMPWTVEPLSQADAVSTAQAISKQATVLESQDMPDIVAKAHVTDADAVTAAKSTNPGGVSVLRNIGRPLDVMFDHPDIHFVEREGRLDAMIGEVTPEMIQDYENTGFYEGQTAVTQKGIEGTVLSVNGRGLVTLMRKSGGPPLRVKAANLLPGRFGDPVRNAPELWNGFKADVLNYMNDEAAKAGMAPIEDIFDPRVGDLMQSRLENYLDRLGINDMADRHAIEAYVNRSFVDEAKDLDPESRDLQASMTDFAVRSQNAIEDPVVSTEEKAMSKGFIWIKDADSAGGVLRDNLNPDGALEIPIASEADVDGFLQNVDRAAPDLTPAGTSVPFDVTENVPTDTTIEPSLGVEESIAAMQEAGWRQFAKESVGVRQFGAQHAAALRQNFAETTQRVNEILDSFAAQRGGGGGAPPEPPDAGAGSWEPWPKRLPGEEGVETLGDQFAALKERNPSKYDELNRKYKMAVFRYTRYNMAGLEKTLIANGIDMGRAWAHYEAMETARIHADNESFPWLKEASEIVEKFPHELLRDNTFSRIHQIEDINARMAEWYRLKDRNYSDAEIKGFIAADEAYTDWNHRWWTNLTGDPVFALTAEREINRYIPQVRARQAVGAKDPYDSTGYLSPNTQFFAEFARENGVQFRVVDPREFIPYMVRSAMFKKYQAAPWQDFVETWQDSRIPKDISAMMLDHARSMKFGYDASGDMAVQGIKYMMEKAFDLPVTDREAMQLMAGPMNAMYMSMLAGRSSIFFRDAMQPMMALAKVRTNYVRDTYVDVLGGIKNREMLNDMLTRGLKGGWLTHDVIPMEGLSAFEEPGGARANELANLTPDQAARREALAQLGDVMHGLPAWLVAPSKSNISTLKWYGKLQQINRLITGESAYRQADAALTEYRGAEMTAALAGDPSMAIPYQKFAKDSFFSSFSSPIANKLKELVDAGQDEEAKNMFAREVSNWTNFKYGRREQPRILRGTFGRIGSTFSNFTGQFIEGATDALSSGEPIHKARYLMVNGAQAGLLAGLTAITGWSFGRWIWGNSVKYAGGPGLEYGAQVLAAIGGAVALSDDRKPSPFQSEALRTTIGGGIAPNPLTLFPYRGYVQSAAEYSAALQGTNPLEQALRYTVTGDRGSRVDVQRAAMTRDEELRHLIEQRALQPGGLPSGSLSPNGGLMPGNPGNRDSQAPAGDTAVMSRSLQQLYRKSHPGGGAMQ
jgi:hypothetical protein